MSKNETKTVEVAHSTIEYDSSQAVSAFILFICNGINRRENEEFLRRKNSSFRAENVFLAKYLSLSDEESEMNRNVNKIKTTSERTSEWRIANQIRVRKKSIRNIT